MPNDAKKRYGQFCGLARSLDIIGDRWTLLIVRELLIAPRRYGELEVALAGVATNLLAARLRELEGAGIVERRAEQLSTGSRYLLTARGEGLREVIDALIRWSAPLMMTGEGVDTFRPSWLAVALPALLRSRATRATPTVRVGVRTRGEGVTLEVSAGRTTATVGIGDEVHAVLSAEPADVFALVTGASTIDELLRRGATLKGDKAALTRVFGSDWPPRPRKQLPLRKSVGRSRSHRG